MKPKLLELRPDRNLLNSNFEGYKLSLATLPVCEKELPLSIERAVPDSSQYSFLHARLFGMHNHLYAEELNGVSYVYFIDNNWCVWKLNAEPFSHQFVEPFLVWKIPRNSERLQGQYNITLRFITSELVVISAPHGLLYILNTGDRSLDVAWNAVYEGDVLDAGKDFVIQDALYNERNELHLLLLRIEQDVSGEHWLNVLNWIVMSCSDTKWNVTASRVLEAGGELYYSCFEPDCKAVYISSEKTFKFVNEDDKENEQTEEQKRYIWSQTVEDITLRLKVPENFVKNSLKVTTKATEITVQYESNTFLSGPLYHNICADLTVWCIKNGMLEITLNKQEEGLMWPEFIVGDTSGEFVVDSCIADEVHQKLSHLCGENDANPLTGTTFNSQQVEECDFVNEENCTLDRIPWDTNEIVYRTNLGTNPVILTVKLHDELAPAFGLRHDVDVCLWQPYKASLSDWPLKHEGTLLAFGYVQASKQQKKFVACTPDLSHSVVCESSRHIFVYCQNKPITNGTLKNRSTGKKVGNIAEQRVISLDNNEILGMHLSNSELFILTESKIYCFKL